jgi:hypothetical protein
MTAGRPLDLDRIRHVANEFLQSSDLSDQVGSDRELMWWHQRAVHQPGVVAGLTVRDDRLTRSVYVAPGLAYDSRGRELVLRDEAIIGLPRRPADGERIEPLALVIHAGAEGRDAQVTWRPLRALHTCDGIPIARFDAKGLRPSTQRARSFERPHVAAGETLPDATSWDIWALDERRGFVLGIQVRVDTSAAGFTEVPCYFAWLNWPRPETDLRAFGPYVTLGLQYVQNETTSGFLFRVLLQLPLKRRDADDSVVSFARRERLSVCWLGVECEQDERSSRRRRHVAVR